MAHPCLFGEECANVTPFTIISDCEGSRLWNALSQALEGASNNETARDVGPWCNMNFGEREEEWALLMRGAIAGDSAAYHRFLLAVAPFLRATARRQFARVGAPGGDHEDIVQEVLLAIHLKRHTWDPSRAIGPWVAAITRNKAIDMLRRRGRQTEIPIEDVIEQLPAEPAGGNEDARDVERMLATLKSAPKRYHPLGFGERRVDSRGRRSSQDERGSRSCGAPPGFEDARCPLPARCKVIDASVRHQVRDRK